MPRTKLKFYVERVTRSMWFLPIAHAVGALLVLYAARWLAHLVPTQFERIVSADATTSILTILASSLLAVAIFAIGSLVTALNATANAATPRARRLIIGDRVAQNNISIFIGAFIFAILALVGISTGYYSDGAQVILLFCTLVVIAGVIVSLIAWIDQITRLGGVEETINLLADAAAAAFSADAEVPLMGGRPLGRVPEAAVPVRLERIGFLQMIDGEALGGVTEEADADIHVALRPGDHVAPGEPVAWLEGAADEETLSDIRSAFVVGDRRSFEADARYGLIALSEIASRALSPGVNDPGTAIDVISTQLRVLVDWRDAHHATEPEVRFPRLHVAGVPPGDFLETAFRWIGRDGAGLLEVQAQLQTALGALALHDPEAFGAAARRASSEALARAEAALTPREAGELRAIAARAFDRDGRPSH